MFPLQHQTKVNVTSSGPTIFSLSAVLLIWRFCTIYKVTSFDGSVKVTPHHTLLNRVASKNISSDNFPLCLAFGIDVKGVHQKGNASRKESQTMIIMLLWHSMSQCLQCCDHQRNQYPGYSLVSQIEGKNHDYIWISSYIYHNISISPSD